MRRRDFLAAGFSVLAPAAAAFSIAAPPAEIERLYLAACDPVEAEQHRRLRRALEATLEGKDKDEAAETLAAARCPTCGCRLAAAE